MSWQLVKIGEFCSTGSGGTPSREIPEYFQGTIPWIKSGDLRENIVTSATEFISTTALKNSSAKMVPEGSILLAMYGATVGRMALLGLDAATNQAVCNITPDSSRAFTKYVYYALLSKVPEFLRNAVGGAQPNISQGIIRDTLIPLPPLPEQKRIAAILDKADSIRRKRQQAIKLADEFLRAVFLDMFGDPVTNPMGWTVSKFSELGEWKSGGTPSRTKPEYFTGDIDWYSAGELNSRYLHGSVEKVSKFAVDNSSTKIFQKGSILLGMYDTAAFKSSILISDAASNQACANLLPNERVNVEWLYDYIQISKENYLKLRRGVRQKNLNLGMIKDFELNLPPMEEQLKYVAFISKFNQACEKNELFKTSSENLFDSISQKAFSGEL